MTITDTPQKYRYEGNGITDTFAFSAKAFSADDIVVEIITRATDELEDTLTLTTDYAITIATAGTASITVTAPNIPSSLQDIQIRRALSQTQDESLPIGSPFPAKIVENAIDRVVGLLQDLDEVINRSMKYPVTSSITTALLPEPVDDAVLCFDGVTGLLKAGATNTELSDAAAQAAIAVVQAGIATTQAGIATTQADTATTQATAAAASSSLVADWASKTSAIVAATDYSAKEFAQGTQASTGGSAKNWAQQTGADVTGASANSRSAKSWAQENLAGATLGGSAKDWAQSASLPDGTNKSAKSYASDASTSETNAGNSATEAAASAAAAAKRTRVTYSGSTTFALTDAAKYLRYTGGGSHIWTLPANATIAFSNEDEIDVFNATAFDLTLTAAASVVVNGVTAGSLVLPPYAGGSFKKEATNTWDYSGHAADAWA